MAVFTKAHCLVGGTPCTPSGAACWKPRGVTYSDDDGSAAAGDGRGDGRGEPAHFLKPVTTADGPERPPEARERSRS